MSYLMLSDDLATRLTRDRIDRSCRMLFVELLTYCSRNLTDGVIDVPLAMVSDHPSVEDAIGELIECGLVEIHERGYFVPEFVETNYTAERVRRLKESARKRKSDYKERQERHSQGDHSMCTRNCPAVRERANAVRNAVPEHVPNTTNSYPLLKERGESRHGADAGALVARPASTHMFRDDAGSGICDDCDLPASNARHLVMHVV